MHSRHRGVGMRDPEPDHGGYAEARGGLGGRGHQQGVGRGAGQVGHGGGRTLRL